MTAPWRAASIRFRLTGWYAVALSLLLVVYATATFVAVRHEFFEQLDDQLQDGFTAARSSLARTAGNHVMWTGAQHHDSENAIEVWSTTGEAIYRSAASTTLSPPAAPMSAPPHTQPQYASVMVNGHRWRTLGGVSDVSGTPVVVRISRSEERLRDQLREILVVLVLGLPVVVGLAGLGGYMIARRALAPIDSLASEARRITADRLHERLSVPNQQDEIGRLAAVINETFARLESSFDQLRRFTADASHELRTPLAVIRGTGEVGLAQAQTVADCKEAMGSMLEEVDRLTNLVDTLLRLSYGDAGTIRLRRELTMLGDLVDEVTTSLTILAEERGQKLSVEVLDDIDVMIDRLVLREAISNVVDNAIKYSRRGATIHIRVFSRDGAGVIEVVDQGPGIPAEHRQRIFDRFFRVDQARSRESGGTGLGLAIAKWAVEANGGVIDADHAPGGGSVFRITLPPSTQTAATQHTDSYQRVGGGHL
jgi:heavy metal sensor kinase